MASLPDSRLLTLVFTDLADSTALKTRMGDRAVGEIIGRHRAHVTDLAADWGGRIIDWAGDGCFLTFETSSAAVLFALRLQQIHAKEPELPQVRTGIHMGEVSERPGPDGDPARPRVEGLAVDLAARISGLARPGQILMSSAVANSARQRMDQGPDLPPIRWKGYGSYTLKGLDEPIDIREAGLADIGIFVAPPPSEKARPSNTGPVQPGAVSGRKFVLLSLAAIMLIAVSGVAFFATRRPNAGAAASSHATGDPSAAFATKMSGGSGFGARPAIAVLPFDNFSPDADQAFFADGLAEDLITRLASWRAFPVISRNSSFKYRGRDLDIKSVSEELGARYLVEGSVRREGEQIRITAKLVDASTGEQVWAENFDRNVSSVFAIQDEISATIAASLVSDLNRAEAERARKRGTDNLEAWSLYQVGLQEFDRYTRDGFAKAKEKFEHAVQQDPRFATALGQLAYAEGYGEVMGWNDIADSHMSKVFEYARRAIELDPREAMAYCALSFAYIDQGDVPNGVDAGRRAVELNPSDPTAWNTLAWAQLMARDTEACIASAQKAIDLNPQGTLASTFDTLYWAYWETGRYEESIATARRAIAERPDYYLGYIVVAMSSVGLGRMEDARTAIDEARRIQPELSIKLVQNYFGMTRPEIDERRNAALRQVGLE